MTEPLVPDLVALATPYALHAMSDAERADIDRQIAEAPPEVAEAFFARGARGARDDGDHLGGDRRRAATVDARAAAGDGRPRPVQQLPSKRANRWRTAILAAAAVVAIGLGALGVGIALRPATQTSTAEQIFAAPDVRTVSGPIPTGGTATVVFSREKNAGVLVMNNVAPPKPGTVYQMWLVGDNGPQSAGTMDAQSVAPSTTAVLPDLGTSKTLAFTVEPGGGSVMPTTPSSPSCR